MAKKELEALKAQKQDDEACRLMLVAEFELEEEAAKEKEALNVVKSIVQMQESEGVEEFTFSEVDAEESEGEEEDMMTNKELVRVQNTSKVSPS